MAKPIKESITIRGTFVSNEQSQANKPSKSYIAISNSIPKVGEHFSCDRLDKNTNGEIIFNSTETTIVQEVKNLASNVFVVTTRNSYYITWVFNMPVENVHFALVKDEPQIGSDLYCYKLKFEGKNIRYMNWVTSTVQEVNCIHGLYKVKTRNSIYVCFPM